MQFRLFALSLSRWVKHIAHHNLKIIIMKQNLGKFPLCGGCSRREKREGLKDGEFYCAIVGAILPNGIVSNDTDATNCVRNGWYEPAI